MKANELMIGDWVYFGSNEYSPSKIEGVLPYDEGVVLDFDNEPIPNDHIHPIPLTEEILKANGFECFVLPNHKKLYSYNNKEIILFWNDRAEIDLLGAMRTITLVHELQHALRLCGLGELADNFKVK